MKFKNHLTSIKATLVHHTTWEDLEKYIPEFVSITWLENFEDINEFMTSRDIDREGIVRETLSWRTLPTALETIRLTFNLEGLDMTNVTHVLRHRAFSFSSQSTDHHDSVSRLDYLIGDEWEGDLLLKAKTLCAQLDDLYLEAQEKGLSHYAARDYMPRAKETKMCMSGNIKDWIAFVNQRNSLQCQPTSDTILASRVRKAILEAYPKAADILEKQMPIEPIEHHYLNAIDKKFNLNTFKPTAQHAKILKERGIDWSKIKFGHSKPKEAYKGFNKFKALRKEIADGNR